MKMFSNSGIRFFGVALACIGAVLMIVSICMMNAAAIGGSLGLVMTAVPFLCLGNIETYLQKISEQQKEILEYQKKLYLATIRKA